MYISSNERREFTATSLSRSKHRTLQARSLANHAVAKQSIHSGSEALPTGAFLVPERRSGSPATIATCNDS